MAIRPAGAAIASAGRSAGLPASLATYTQMASYNIEAATSGSFRDLLSIHDVLGGGEFTNPYVWVGLDDDGSHALYLEVFDGSTSHVDLGPSIAIGEPFHLALRITGTLHELLYSTDDLSDDAEVVASITAANNIASLAVIYFYADAAPGGKSRLTNGKIWTAALTAAEIRLERASYALARTADIYSAPRFRWATDLRDSSGQGRDFTLTSSPGTFETVQGFPGLTSSDDFAEGRMMIPGADVSLPTGSAPEEAAVLSASTGDKQAEMPWLPPAECGDNLPSGIFALMAQGVFPGGNVTFISVHNPDGSVIATPTLPTPPTNASSWSPIRRVGTDQFIYLRIDINGPGAGGVAPRLSTIDDAGTLGGTTITMPASANGGASALAAQHDLSIVYFGFRTGAGAASARISNGIGRLSWPSGTELDPLIPTAAGLNIGRDLIVTEDGDILVTILAVPNEIRRYNDAGDLLATYPLDVNANVGDSVELSYEPDDPTAFWVRTYPSATTSRFLKIRIEDGETLIDFTVTTVGGGGSGPTLVPVSCPFLIAPGAVAEGLQAIIGPHLIINFPRRIFGADA